MDLYTPPATLTACGLTLDAVRRIMADRVTVWADGKRAARMARNPLDKAEWIIRTARQRRWAVHPTPVWVAPKP